MAFYTPNKEEEQQRISAAIGRLKDYLAAGGELYTLNDIRNLTPQEVHDNWAKVQHSLVAIGYAGEF